MTLRFAAPVYPGGRHCLLCGSVTVGAVFPPAGDPETAHQNFAWVWRVWITSRGQATEGRCPTEQAAKNAAIGTFRDFLRAADLKEMEPAE